MRDLSLAGKITVFKTLPILKLVHLALVRLLTIIWFIKHFKIDNKSLCNNSLANQGVNHVGQLFNENGMTKAWLDIKIQFI